VSAILEKVNKLMALADSSSLEESRTAAVLAIKLIREHGLLQLPDNHNETKPRTHREGLRHMAEAKAGRFVEFLRRKADAGTFPVFQSRTLVDRAVEDGSLRGEDRDVFSYYLRKALREFIVAGALEYQAGHHGYRLKLARFWENAA